MKIEQFVNELKENRIIDEDDISKDVLQKMIEKDTIIELTFYPDTPVGSYIIYGYDLDLVLDEAINLF